MLTEKIIPLELLSIKLTQPVIPTIQEKYGKCDILLSFEDESVMAIVAENGWKKNYPNMAHFIDDVGEIRSFDNVTFEDLGIAIRNKYPQVVKVWRTHLPILEELYGEKITD